MWGYSQKRGFWDLAEDNVAVDDVVEPSLEYLLSWSCHLLYFLQQIIRSSFRTSRLCVLKVAFEVDAIPHSL